MLLIMIGKIDWFKWLNPSIAWSCKCYQGNKVCCVNLLWTYDRSLPKKLCFHSLSLQVSISFFFQRILFQKVKESFLPGAGNESRSYNDYSALDKIGFMILGLLKALWLRKSEIYHDKCLVFKYCMGDKNSAMLFCGVFVKFIDGHCGYCLYCLNLNKKG